VSPPGPISPSQQAEIAKQLQQAIDKEMEWKIKISRLESDHANDLATKEEEMAEKLSQALMAKDDSIQELEGKCADQEEKITKQTQQLIENASRRAKEEEERDAMKSPTAEITTKTLDQDAKKIEIMQQELRQVQEQLMEMPKKERKAAKAKIAQMEAALDRKVKGLKSERASQQASPGGGIGGSGKNSGPATPVLSPPAPSLSIDQSAEIQAQLQKAVDREMEWKIKFSRLEKDHEGEIADREDRITELEGAVRDQIEKRLGNESRAKAEALVQAGELSKMEAALREQEAAANSIAASAGAQMQNSAVSSQQLVTALNQAEEQSSGYASHVLKLQSLLDEPLGREDWDESNRTRREQVWEDAEPNTRAALVGEALSDAADGVELLLAKMLSGDVNPNPSAL